MTKVYTVRVVRPVFQSVAIEVQALNHNSAMSKALRRAAALPQPEWTDRKFEDGEIAMHVETVLDHQRVHDTSANPHRDIEEFRSGDGGSGPFRYLILLADLGARVGRVLSQPWFTRADPMLQADLCSDWVEPIGFILENDGLGEGAHAAIGTEACGNDNVIEFPASHLGQDRVELKS